MRSRRGGSTAFGDLAMVVPMVVPIGISVFAGEKPVISAVSCGKYKREDGLVLV